MKSKLKSTGLLAGITILLLLMMVLVSCEKDNLTVPPTNNYSVDSFDDIDDFPDSSELELDLCFEPILPITIVVNNDTTTVDSLEILEDIIDDCVEETDVQILYPIDIVLAEMILL